MAPQQGQPRLDRVWAESGAGKWFALPGSNTPERHEFWRQVDRAAGSLCVKKGTLRALVWFMLMAREAVCLLRGEGAMPRTMPESALRVKQEVERRHREDGGEFVRLTLSDLVALHGRESEVLLLTIRAGCVDEWANLGWQQGQKPRRRLSAFRLWSLMLANGFGPWLERNLGSLPRTHAALAASPFFSSLRASI